MTIGTGGATGITNLTLVNAGLISFTTTLADSQAGANVVLEGNTFTIPSADTITLAATGSTLTFLPQNNAALTLTSASNTTGANTTFSTLSTSTDNNLTKFTAGTLVLGGTAYTGVITSGATAVVMPTTLPKLTLASNDTVAGSLATFCGGALPDGGSGTTTLTLQAVDCGRVRFCYPERQRDDHGEQFRAGGSRGLYADASEQHRECLEHGHHRGAEPDE